MENKTIIDGIDVSECKHYTNLNMNCLELPTQPFKCQNDKNCYFKQLARAKEENEKLKSDLDFERSKRKTFQTELQAKEQECEELKQEKEKIKMQYNCYACGTCKGREDYKNMKRHCENAINANHKYKQALDEIEEFCTVYSANHDAYETVYKYILAFINKAKENK